MMQLCSDVRLSFIDPSTKIEHSCTQICNIHDPVMSPPDCQDFCADFYKCLLKSLLSTSTTPLALVTTTFTPNLLNGKSTKSGAMLNRSVVIMLSVTIAVVCSASAVLIHICIIRERRRLQQNAQTNLNVQSTRAITPEIELEEFQTQQTLLETIPEHDEMDYSSEANQRKLKSPKLKASVSSDQASAQSALVVGGPRGVMRSETGTQITQFSATSFHISDTLMESMIQTEPLSFSQETQTDFDPEETIPKQITDESFTQTSVSNINSPFEDSQGSSLGLVSPRIPTYVVASQNLARYPTPVQDSGI